MSFLSLFLNKETTSSPWDQKYIKHTLIELLIYLIFLITVSIISFGMSGSTMYYFSNMLMKSFIDKPFPLVTESETTFRELTTVPEYWSFLETVFLDSVYGTDTEDHDMDTEHDLTMYDENLFLSAPRIRQLKVRNDSCNIHELFKRNFNECYGRYSDENEDKSSFGSVNSTIWNYHSGEELEGITTWGLLDTYPAGGFFQDMNYSRNDSTEIIQNLKENSWISRGTRVVFIEFTLYNVNVNMFCVAKLVVEIPPTGGVVTSYIFRTVKLLLFVKWTDYVILFFEVIFGLQLIWFTAKEVMQIYYNRWDYLKSFWNWIDLGIIFISYTSLSFSLYRSFHIKSKLDDYHSKYDHFINFDSLAFWQIQYNDFMAICVFFVWIKVFKYLSFNKTLYQFSKTLQACAKDLFGFAVMFFIVFIAFAQLGYIVFGTENENFRSFIDSIFTMLRTVLGDFDYLAIERANRILGPIFFLTYIFFVFFVLLNMFLAIINDAYSDVKSSNVGSDLQVGKYIIDNMKNVFNRLLGRPIFDNKRQEVEDREREEINAEKETDIVDSHAHLITNQSKQSDLLENLGLQDIFQEIPDSTIITEINERIDRVEGTVDDIVIKLEKLILLLETQLRN